jgi:hypothetical protein
MDQPPAASFAGRMYTALRTPLDSDDLKRCLGSDITLMPYYELRDVRDIDEIFDPQGRCMLLYGIESKTNGHWVCLKRYEDHIEFFDSIGVHQEGGVPDSQLHWVSAAKRAEMGEDSPYLKRLMRKKGLPVTYNKATLQDDDPAIATCGRHCVSRLWKSALALDAYVDWLQRQSKQRKRTPDEYVTELTFRNLHK